MLDKTFAYLQVLDTDKDNPIRHEAEAEVTLLRSLPEIVLLVGSSRFKLAFEDEAERLTLEGRIVMGKHVFKPGNDWNLPEGVRDMLHATQFRKVDLANRLHVINVDGYLGSDTYNAIRYAVAHDKTITFLEDKVAVMSRGGSESNKLTTGHFLQATRRRVEFEEGAFGD